jgi:hypothetical protein
MIVELATGRVLARLTGSIADNPRQPSDHANLNATLMSGKSRVPVVIPSTARSLACPSHTRALGVPATRLTPATRTALVAGRQPDIDNWTARSRSTYNLISGSATPPRLYRRAPGSVASVLTPTADRCARPAHRERAAAIDR